MHTQQPCHPQRHSHLRTYNISLVSDDPMLTSYSVLPIAMASLTSNASRSRNKVSNPVCSAARSYPRLDMPTQTLLPQTPSYEHTISHSSSEVEAPSSVAGPCKWKWKQVARHYSSTSSSPWVCIIRLSFSHLCTQTADDSLMTVNHLDDIASTARSPRSS